MPIRRLDRDTSRGQTLQMRIPEEFRNIQPVTSNFLVLLVFHMAFAKELALAPQELGLKATIRDKYDLTKF